MNDLTYSLLIAGAAVLVGCACATIALLVERRHNRRDLP